MTESRSGAARKSCFLADEMANSPGRRHDNRSAEPSCLWLFSCVRRHCPRTRHASILTMSVAISLQRGGHASRNLRVQCKFELKVEHADQALGDRYFPNALIQEGKGRKQSYRPKPQTLHWVEDVETRGEKYRNDFEFFRPDGGKSSGSKSEKFYNGANSWSYARRQWWCFSVLGATPHNASHAWLYQDIIGFPRSPIAKEEATGNRTSPISSTN